MKPIIELNAITVRYTEEDRPALKNVSLSIEQENGLRLSVITVQENRPWPKRSTV